MHIAVTNEPHFHVNNHINDIQNITFIRVFTQSTKLCSIQDACVQEVHLFYREVHVFIRLRQKSMCCLCMYIRPIQSLFITDYFIMYSISEFEYHNCTLKRNEQHMQ